MSPNNNGNDLECLDEKLKDAREEFDENYNPKEDENLSSGARAGVELVGAFLGGGLIGYGLDYLFGTSPILFLVFILLGTVTGFYNVYRITNDLGTAVGSKKPSEGLQQGAKDAKNAPPDNP